MTEPASLPSATARFSLPLLFPGQAQREFAVNEAFARCDILLHATVSEEISTPPADAADGEAWLVGAAATGDFADRDGMIAARCFGQWMFIAPHDGMRLFDRSTRREFLFSGGWLRPQVIDAPTSGAVVDAEARITIGAILDVLRNNGIVE